MAGGMFFFFWILLIMLFQSRRRPIRSQTFHRRARHLHDDVDDRRTNREFRSALGFQPKAVVRTRSGGAIAVVDRRGRITGRYDPRRLTRLQTDGITTIDGGATVGCARKENGNFRADNRIARGFDDNRYSGGASGIVIVITRTRISVCDTTPIGLPRQSSRVIRWSGGSPGSTNDLLDWTPPHAMVFGVVARPSLVAGLCVVLFAGRPPVHGHRDYSDDEGGSYADEADRTPTAIGATVRHCLAGVDPFLPCVNERAMAALRLAESADSMSLGPDLEMAAADLAPKGVYSIGKPTESRPVVDISYLVDKFLTR